ncbi:MAG: FtsX-like permease family protein, partial [Chloroflexota bacterium]
LLGCLAVILAIVVGAPVWPAWRAAGKPPATTLRGAELSGRARRSRAPGGPFGLGLRLATARRGRTLVTALVVGAATAVVLLMLALASFLQSLQDDPDAIGKRYQLTASLPLDRVGDVEGIDGVADASPRYELNALDSFQLDETIDVVAYPDDHTDFEAPPLAEGRRIESADEAEVGRGLADALGLEVGGTLAMQLPSGQEAQFAVVGIVRAIDNEGRVAYVRPDQILAADPGATAQIAVKLDDDADEGAVRSALVGLGAEPQDAAGTTTRDQRFLGTLAGVLRVVAGVNGLISLFILVQALAVTALERRQALAVLRAGGAGRGTITAILAGAAAAVLMLAVPLGFALERFVLGPLVSRLAAGYATPGLATPVIQVVLVAVVLVLLGLGAAWEVARRSERAPIPLELRGG